MSYDELKEQLRASDKIVLWSCNDCVRYNNKIGGREALDRLELKLRHDGYTVVRKELIGVSCQPPLVRLRAENQATKGIYKEADVVVVIACEDATEKVRRVFRNKKVIGTTKSIGLGTYSSERGMRLVCPLEELEELEPSVEGIPIEEVAKRLRLYAEPF
jgi:hypothetical protein